MSSRFGRLLAVAVALGAAGPGVARPALAAVVLVHDDAPPGGDGQTWATAYHHLQDALAVARDSGGSITEIWVAAGTYRPDQGQNQTRGDRTATFQLVENVALRGGFAGHEDPATFDPAGRDIALNETILSGEIGLTDETYDNSYHVVTGADDATLDGFTITAGEATHTQDSGGGMYNEGVSPAVIDCTFRENWARERGAGMYNGALSNPTLVRCTFKRNGLPRYSPCFGCDAASHDFWPEPTYGGGVYNDLSSSPTLIDCSFIENGADRGGGIYSFQSGGTISNCVFSANWAELEGGGIYIWSGTPTLIGCAFDDNGVLPEDIEPPSQPTRLGGGIAIGGGTPILDSCTFTHNQASLGGGGISNNSGGSVLIHCTFEENSAGWGGGLRNTGFGPAITGCAFVTNSANRGGGVSNSGGSVTLIDCTFRENSSPGVGGGMFNEGASVQWTGCTFTGNSAAGTFYYGSSGGGGGLYNLGNNPTWTDCTFIANATTTTKQYGRGGGLSNHGANPTWTHCMFTGNTTAGQYGDGAGVYNHGIAPTWVRCTFNENVTTWQNGAGGGVFNEGSDPTLTDCTFTGNSAAVYGSGRGGGGMFNNAIGLTMTRCAFKANTVTGYADGCGLYNRGANVVLVDSDFIGNAPAPPYSSSGYGGGIYIYLVASGATLTNCKVLGNSVASQGGGIAVTGSGIVTLTNCSFSGNSTTGAGGGISTTSRANSRLIGCTFYSNSATSHGGGLYGRATLLNCILWESVGGQIYSTGTTNVTYSNVQGGYPGVGNIDAPPTFRDADGPDGVAGTEDDDLRLAVGSPCIDAGDNAAVPPDALDLDGDGDTAEPTPIDLAGGSRFLDDPRTADSGSGTPPIVDMGAYEFDPPPPGDCDYDGDVDGSDLDCFAACAIGPAVPQDDPTCRIARLDGDDDVDQADFAIFQRCFSGENVPADPRCDE